MMEFPEAETEDEDLEPIPADFVPAVNHAAAYQMYLSDVYLSMACCYHEEKKTPLFVMFFEDQNEVKRFQAKRFLRYLRARKGQIHLPVIKKLHIIKWDNIEHAIRTALKIENKLTKVLEDMQAAAAQAVDTSLLKLVEEHLTKQKRNTAYLEYQINYQKKLQELKQQESMLENLARALASASSEEKIPASAAGEETTPAPAAVAGGETAPAPATVASVMAIPAPAAVAGGEVTSAPAAVAGGETTPASVASGVTTPEDNIPCVPSEVDP